MMQPAASTVDETLGGQVDVSQQAAAAMETGAEDAGAAASASPLPTSSAAAAKGEILDAEMSPEKEGDVQEGEAEEAAVEEPAVKDEKRARPEEAHEDEPHPKRPRRLSASPGTPLEGSADLRRSSRERKAVRHEEFISPKEEEDSGGATIIQGRGQRLETIPEFVANLEPLRPAGVPVRKLYKALYKITGKTGARKNAILAWSGLPSEEPTSNLVDSLSASCTAVELTEIGKKLLGLQTGIDGRTTKHAWAESIADVLVDPQAGKFHPAVASESRGTGGGGRGRGPTGYQLYCAENRDKFKSENPGKSQKELMKVMGDAWRTLSDEEKQNYVKIANARKARSPAPKRKARRRASSEEEEEQPAEEDDDEEGEGAEAEE